jgi:hypothetical protein
MALPFLLYQFLGMAKSPTLTGHGVASKFSSATYSRLQGGRYPPKIDFQRTL